MRASSVDSFRAPGVGQEKVTDGDAVFENSQRSDAPGVRPGDEDHADRKDFRCGRVGSNSVDVRRARRPTTGWEVRVFRSSIVSNLRHWSANIRTRHGQSYEHGLAFSAPRGERLVDKRPHEHWKTTTLIAALGIKGVPCSTVVDGSVNGDVLEAFVEQVLIPQRKPVWSGRRHPVM